MGPFPINTDFQTLDFEIIYLSTKFHEVSVFKYSNWKLNNKELMMKVWDTVNNYLIVRFDLFNEEASQMYGDFKLKISVGTISFYFWLNVIAIKE